MAWKELELCATGCVYKDLNTTYRVLIVIMQQNSCFDAFSSQAIYCGLAVLLQILALAIMMKSYHIFNHFAV